VAPRAYEPRRLKGSLRLNRWAVLVRTGRDPGARNRGKNCGRSVSASAIKQNLGRKVKRLHALTRPRRALCCRAVLLNVNPLRTLTYDGPRPFIG
jgi:hypothetical protein